MSMVVPAGSGRDPAPVFSCLSAGDGRAFGAGAVHRNAEKTRRKLQWTRLVSPFWSLPVHLFSRQGNCTNFTCPPLPALQWPRAPIRSSASVVARWIFIRIITSKATLR